MNSHRRARALALALIVMVYGACRAATDDRALGRDRAPSAKQRFIAVVGMKTFARGAEEQSVGAGLGEELSTRLRTDREHFEVLERLQVNEVLAARGGLKCMLDYGDNPGVEGEVDPEGKPMADAMLAEVQETQDKPIRKLYGADLLLLGSVTCGEKSLVANTRLVSVATGVVEQGVSAETSRSTDGLEHDLQALAVDLTVKWAGELGVEPTPQMQQVSKDAPGLYLAWCKAQEHLLRGEMEQCEAVATEALRNLPGDRLFEALCETRDLAYESLIGNARQGSPDWRKWVDRNITEAEAALDYARAFKTVASYYAGRAQERAGNLKAAEDRYRECLRERPSRLLWDFEAGAEIGTPVVAGGVAYAVSGSVGGHYSLCAVGIETGDLLWELNTSDYIDAPVVVDGIVYAGAGDSHLRALDAGTGSLLWEYEAENGIYTPVVVGGVAYAGAEDGHLRAFDAKAGTVKWDRDAGADVRSPAVVDGVAYAQAGIGEGPFYLCAFAAETGAPLWAVETHCYADAPLVADGVAYTVYASTELIALDAKTGGVRWQVQAEDYLDLPVLADGVVYVGSESDGKRLRALDARDGHLVWESASDEGFNTPTVADGVVYAGSNDGHLRAFDARTGARQWDFDAGTGVYSPLVADGIVYARAGDRFCVLDARTGVLLWDFRTGGWIAGPTVGDGVVYVPSDDHHLRALSTALGEGSDYAERAIARLVDCLVAGGRGREALRLGARLWRETPARDRRTSDAFVAAASSIWESLGTAQVGLRAALPGLPDAPEAVWSFTPDDHVDTRQIDNERPFAVSDGVVCAVSGPVDGHDCLRAFDAQNGTVLWGLEVLGDIRTPAMRDGVAYVVSRSGDGPYRYLRALDAKTGEKLWGFDADELIDVPVVVDGVAYAGGECLRAFETKAGTVLWASQPGDGVSTPTVTDGVAYAVAIGEPYRLRAFDAGSGEELWNFTEEVHSDNTEGRGPPNLLHQLVRILSLGDAGDAPVIADGIVYAVSNPEGGPGRLRALDAKTGVVLWNFEAEDWIDRPVVANGMVYAGSLDSHLRALGAKDGSLLWDFKAEDLIHTPVVADGVAYASSHDERLRAFSARSGELLWEFEADEDIGLPAVANGVVYVGAELHGEHIRALDAKTGSALWAFDAGAGISSPLIADGMAYSGCEGDGLRAFDINSIRAATPPEVVWSTSAQFWSYVIWGKAGLAVRKIMDGLALSQIIKYDAWDAPDALAAAVDHLAKLGDQRQNFGQWNGPIALSLDPETLCPPELGAVVRRDPAGQSIRPAAQLYLRAANSNDDVEDGLEYTEEAVRLAPQWDEARTAHEQIRRTCVELHRQMGDWYYDRGQYPNAIAEYGRCIEIDPSDAVAWGGRGSAFLMSGDPQRAINELTQAVTLDPEDAWAFCERGDAYCGLEQYDLALRDFSRAIELNQEYESAHYNRGRTLRVLSRWDAALADFGKCIELNGDDAQYWDARASCYHEKGQYPEAISDRKKAVELAPEDPYYRVDLCWDYYKAGDLPSAITTGREAAKVAPDSPWAVGNLAISLLASGADEESVAQYRRLVEIGAQEALDAGCGKDLDDLLAKRPDLHLAHFCLALLSEGAGNSEEAAEHYGAYIAGAPEGRWAGEAREHIAKLRDAE